MEIWKPINGFENYEVSSLGNVRNIKTGHILSIVIKKKRSRYGYAYVHLCDNEKKKIRLIHRLVAEAFIPNPLNLPQVNHKDENSLNNEVGNLEWCTAKYNMNYGTYKERSKKRMIENNPFRGKHHTLESKEKMRLAKKGRPSNNRRAIIINGVEFESITQAMKTLHLSTRAIYRILKKEGN